MKIGKSNSLVTCIWHYLYKEVKLYVRLTGTHLFSLCLHSEVVCAVLIKYTVYGYIYFFNTLVISRRHLMIQERLLVDALFVTDAILSCKYIKTFLILNCVDQDSQDSFRREIICRNCISSAQAINV